MLRVNHLSFSYGSKKILKELHFSLSEGEIVALIGPSGSGKTTLFRLIAGLLTPQEGELVFRNKPISKPYDYITYMQQEDLLLSWRTTLGNLLLLQKLGCRFRDSVERKKDEKIALNLLEKVGLKGSEYLYPHQLSGGMRQRAALARALLQNRPLLLLDEPFGSLDLLIREELYGLIKEIRKEYNKSILLITHDFRDALSIADRILILKEGKITHDFTIEQAFRNDPIHEAHLIGCIRNALEEKPNKIPANELGAHKFANF